ncbi:hypothetical protein MAR_015019 [Mya arenaria]|uniref:HSF-type DNA-binding domain-containing protein n=1 Tax=Mya arenaria TaxID=6604 RepID=A0ABY7FG48_MYAAR|nr:hypothetical protein MAR_015019 [Mya arenaria]
MEILPKRRYRLIMDFKANFPEKLYDVCNDGALVHWNPNGSLSPAFYAEMTVTDFCPLAFLIFTAKIRQWEKFAKYPGFLQIPSFLNFKRLFREYGFERDINQNGIIEWSHPWFVRGRREMVNNIKTRRKSFQCPTPNQENEGLFGPAVVIPTEGKRRYSTRRRRKTPKMGHSNESLISYGAPDFGGGGDTRAMLSSEGKSFVVKPPQAIYIEDGTPVKNQRMMMPHQHVGDQLVNVNQNAKVERDIRGIMNNFAKNEFTLEEYNEYITKKRRLEEQMKTDKDDTTDAKDKQFWWLYENKADGNVPNQDAAPIVKQLVSGHNGSNQGAMPCGFCKCCSAISNYVNVFGEIPENIQVIDYLEDEVIPNQEVTVSTDPATHDVEVEVPANIDLNNNGYNIDHTLIKESQATTEVR